MRVLSKETVAAIEAVKKRYPTKLASTLPALHLAQKQLGHLSIDAEHDVAEVLDVPPARVHEVVTFYTMFHDHKVGKHVVKICRNLSCQLRGADKIIAHAERVLGIKCGETTADGRVTLEHEECLAACGTAPMLWHGQPGDGGQPGNETFVENLTEEKLEKFLKGLS
jgi:NADH-quinone oxidoreductase subunit E